MNNNLFFILIIQQILMVIKLAVWLKKKTKGILPGRLITAFARFNSKAYSKNHPVAHNKRVFYPLMAWKRVTLSLSAAAVTVGTEGHGSIVSVN